MTIFQEELVFFLPEQIFSGGPRCWLRPKKALPKSRLREKKSVLCSKHYDITRLKVSEKEKEHVFLVGCNQLNVIIFHVGWQGSPPCHWPLVRLSAEQWFFLFYNVFRATRYKTTSLPAALNQARRIDTLFKIVLSCIV
jgi:hypothetical protein